MIIAMSHAFKLVVVMCLAMSNQCYEAKFTDQPMTFPTEAICEEKGAEAIERIAKSAESGEIPPYFVVAKCEVDDDGFSARHNG